MRIPRDKREAIMVRALPGRFLLLLLTPFTLWGMCGSAQAAQTPPSPILAFGSAGTGPGQFLMPRDIAIDAAGRLYVVDQSGNRVVVFDVNGQYLFTFGSKGSGLGQLYYPTGVCIGPDGDVYVADRENNRIQEFRWWGEPVRTIGSAGTGGHDLVEPNDVAVDADGNLYMPDGNYLIDKYDRAGNYVTSWGDGDDPWGITVSEDGTIWVTEASHVFGTDSNGHVLSTYVPNVDGSSLFYGTGVCTDTFGNLTLADDGNHRVLTIDARGNASYRAGALKASCDPSGNCPETIPAPQGVAMDRGGDVFVVDAMTYQILKFAPRPLANPPTWGRVKATYR